MSKTKEELEDKNIQDALQLADDIYKIVLDPKFVEFDADTRHSVVMKKYPNFANTFPVIVRFMSRDLKYNHKAFKKFLDKQRTDPGSAMDGFISNQANYAKYLYIEQSKKMSRHWSTKIANEIWSMEYNHMNESVKKLERDKKAAENEFTEEKEGHLKIKKAELLNFIQNETKDNIIDVDADMDNFHRASLGLPPKSLGDVIYSKLELQELVIFTRQLKNYKLSLVEDIAERKKQLNKLEKIVEPSVVDISAFTKDELVIHTADVKSSIVNLEKELLELNRELYNMNQVQTQEVVVNNQPKIDMDWIIGTNKCKNNSHKNKKK